MDTLLIKHFIHCTWELHCAKWPLPVVVFYGYVCNEKFRDRSLNEIALLHPFNQHALPRNFDNCLKKRVFERRLRLKRTDVLFFIWHCAHFFDISTAQLCELFVEFSEWQERLENSCLLYGLDPVV